MANFNLSHLENRSTDFDETWNLELHVPPGVQDQISLRLRGWSRWTLNTQFATVSFFPRLFLSFFTFKLARPTDLNAHN